MARPKLTNEQRLQVLEWIVAGYSISTIQRRMEEKGWPEITQQALSNYRQRYAPELERIRQERYKDVMVSGLALKEERIKQLQQHALDIEEMRLHSDPKSGKLVNEKAWRETLNQIAEETGDKTNQLLPSEIIVRFVPSQEMIDNAKDA